jgi:hypothetical protein
MHLLLYTVNGDQDVLSSQPFREDTLVVMQREVTGTSHVGTCLMLQIDFSSPLEPPFFF